MKRYNAMVQGAAFRQAAKRSITSIVMYYEDIRHSPPIQ